MPTFPDYSAQEEPIRTRGDVELLRKRGVKILRVRKTTWGREDDLAEYEHAAPFFKGRVLGVGLGMGNSAVMIQALKDVTELVSYEIEPDVALVYGDEHSGETKHSIVVADAHLDKPSGDFDTVLYELEISNQALYDQALDYLRWAWGQVVDGGAIVLRWSSLHDALAKDAALEKAQLSYLSVATGLKPRLAWIKIGKPALSVPSGSGL